MKKFFILSLMVLSSACGSGNKALVGVERINLAVLDGWVHLGFAATQLPLDVGLQIPVPQLGNAVVSVAPDVLSGGSVFQFSAEIDSLFSQGLQLGESGLPSGGRLPGVQSGKMHRADVAVGNTLFSFYVSKEGFALFVPVYIEQKGWLKFWAKPVSFLVQDDQGNQLGKAYAIPGNQSGVFVLLPTVARAHNP